MIITLDEALLHPQPRYCGIRPRHILYESAYSILCRFSLFNVITGRPLVRIINQHCGAGPARYRRSKNLSNIESLRVDGMQELLGLSPWQVESLFLTPTFVKPDSHVASMLRFCPACLAQGRHFTLFQYELVGFCPIHGIGLRNACPACGASASYKLDANLFKYPYGCWQCGRQLGAARDQQSLRFISTMGMGRLRQAYRVFELQKGGGVTFDIFGAADFEPDNVLQLSMSIKQFAQTESDLFRELQELACDPKLNIALSWHPTFFDTKLPMALAPEESEEALANELASISKCIFRHFKKLHFPALRLSDRLLSMLWRDIQGISLPAEYYGGLAYIDWLSYWRNAKVPCDLHHSVRGCQKKMLGWIAEKKRHRVFQQASTPSSQRWLLRQILACEISTLLLRQLEQGQFFEQGVEAQTLADVSYHRLIHPVCWAVFFSDEGGGKSNLTFVSAPSWRGEGRNGGDRMTPPGFKPFVTRNFMAALRSRSA